MRGYMILTVLVLGVLPACGHDPDDDLPPGTPKLIVTSQVFAEGGAIPRLYTCDGKDVSPPLAWSGVPRAAKTLALVVDDPDAPMGTFCHWLLFNLPAYITGLVDDLAKTEEVRVPSPAPPARQGRNDFGKPGYDGPCPPSGTHHYRFHVYALDLSLTPEQGASRKALLAAIRGHVVAEGQLTGIYKR
jgi:Raf kinase inhibitor-like YbhB/YbcL family protein